MTAARSMIEQVDEKQDLQPKRQALIPLTAQPRCWNGWSTKARSSPKFWSSIRLGREDGTLSRSDFNLGARLT